MKKFILALIALFAMTVQSSAMSYEQARQQALFLTDKMAYELNLTEEQYEAAYEVNLDYLMSIHTPDDLYGTYWTHRNLDLSYILFDWQYRAFCAASYFYRPLYWDAGYWHFGIYARYPHRDYFYFGRPHFWTVYRGGHSWHMNGGRSWYHGRTFNHGGGPRDNHFGMRDGFKRGDYHHGFDNNRNRPGSNHHNGIDNRPNTGRNNGNVRPNTGGTNRPNTGGSNRPNGSTVRPDNGGNTTNGTRNFGGSRNINTRESSTRTTVTQQHSNSNVGTRSNIGSQRMQATPSRSFTPSSSQSTRQMHSVTRPSTSGSSTINRSSSPSRSFGGSHSSGISRPTGGNSHGGGHFGGRR